MIPCPTLRKIDHLQILEVYYINVLFLMDGGNRATMCKATTIATCRQSVSNVTLLKLVLFVNLTQCSLI